jgi:hypothetical protein
LQERFQTLNRQCLAHVVAIWWKNGLYFIYGPLFLCVFK